MCEAYNWVHIFCQCLFSLCLRDEGDGLARARVCGPHWYVNLAGWFSMDDIYSSVCEAIATASLIVHAECVSRGAPFSVVVVWTCKTKHRRSSFTANGLRCIDWSTSAASDAHARTYFRPPYCFGNCMSDTQSCRSFAWTSNVVSRSCTHPLLS